MAILTFSKSEPTAFCTI